MSATNLEPATEPFSTLWAQNHDTLCWFVCSRLSNAEDAEDILQEVFLSIYHRLGTVRDPDRLESWMYQIARNRIIDHYRRQRQWVELSEAIAADEEAEEPVIDHLLPSHRRKPAPVESAGRRVKMFHCLPGMKNSARFQKSKRSQCVCGLRRSTGQGGSSW